MRRIFATTTLITMGSWILGIGCDSDTGRNRVEFDVEIASTGGAALTNEHGYEVTLTEAKLHLGAMYFFEGDPLFQAAIRGLFATPRAFAHPGHYTEGEALADVLTEKTVDLLSREPVLFGHANGVSGSYNSLRITLARGADHNGHTATIAGSATKGTETITFTGVLDLDLPIEGVAFGQQIEDSNGKVRIEIDLQEWVKRIDFSRLATGMGPATLDPGSQPHNGLTRGVNNNGAFKLSWIN